MKSKSLLIVFALTLFIANAYAQNQPYISKDLKNYSVQSSLVKPERDILMMENQTNPYVSNKSFSEHTIGTTQYDLQSNKSIDNRIHLYEDKTIGAIWTIGSGNFSNRGTGYNYFDGTSWGPMPTNRIEGNTRAGWGSYAPFKSGEIVIAHDGVVDLVMSTTETKGSGEWTTSKIKAPVDAELTWPRVITVGDTIHVLSVSFTENTTYQNMKFPIIYSRSVDAGITWTHGILPGMDFNSNQLSYSAEVYSWATPHNGNLAFIVGNMWSDVYIMKSVDGGETWQKITIFQHPNPFTFDTGVPLDTTYVTDGLLDVEFDSNGKLHAVFGATRVLVEDPLSETFSWFPFVSYVAYWNEDFGVYTNLDIEFMMLSGRAIAWIQDLDDDGQLYPEFSDFNQIVNYGNHGLVSQPQLTIDENNHMFVTFAHLNENLNTGAPNYTYYRHIWATKSENGGQNWSSFSEITGSVVHEFSECVFASMSNTSDEYVHIIFQMDDLPGLGTGTGANHQQNENAIIYIRVLKSDIGETSANIAEYNTINSVQVYPNPATDFVTVNIVSPIKTSASIKIYNIFGQKVYDSAVNISAGNNPLVINTENLTTGLYIIHVESGNFKTSQKMLKK
jgi:hypothetical protein